MPDHPKAQPGSRTKAPLTQLEMPVIGMESEFNVWLDEVEINPEPFWKHPRSFIDAPLIPREKTSVQVPTGGAVYFDRGVIEVVTPVIELAQHSTARMVRNLWEQIGFVREQLTRWGQQHGHTVRLKAYSSHYNISYEVPKSKQTKHRNEKKLALLLAHILPVPVMVAGANRRSTGVGVRPRGGRIEVTVDFTPDPGLMVATATLVVGIVRAVMAWPSYELSMISRMGVPVVAGVVPGKHTTRKGWLTKDFHFPKSPFTCDIDEPSWTTQFGEKRSLRDMALETAWLFRKSIREYSDPFSFRLLFAVLEGRAPSLLDLADRPRAYEDVGNLARWGMVIDELRNFDRREPARTIEIEAAQPQPPAVKEVAVKGGAVERVRQPRPPAVRHLERRNVSLLDRRKGRDRRMKSRPLPFPDRRLSRSAYEQVFLKLVSGGKLRQGTELYTPIGMKGWYHAVFRRMSDGRETTMTIDELLKKLSDWV